ncbi:hypothetical protein [Microseira wollei]|uniref:Uncharacterized protein n=1 Tax=Microseira wollei NIES-4236 TaxID=2530354 RepID=A0AAV3XQT2_9CYAN|nr:hypothetical protein [Microseira wollei]GET43966.1 hypothetical protein MiSe_87920 [Microseira wollei NIES-4236]
MTTYSFGDVVLVPFPFTDQTSSDHHRYSGLQLGGIQIPSSEHQKPCGEP